MPNSGNVHRKDALIEIRVQADDFDISTEIAELANGRPEIGAVVSFTGLCRDEGGRLSALELEHYPGMAEMEIARIGDKACTRWPITGLRVIHRVGKILPGENIVLVVCASSHRQAAFDAANYLMDFLKTSAPFWKKEHLLAGGSGEWVDAKDTDDQALVKWET